MQRSCAETSWAVSSTHVMSSPSVSSVPSHVLLRGQVLHQVIRWLPPPTGAQLPAVHVLPSCTVPARFISQSSRLVAALQALPMPVRQQNGGSRIGSPFFPPLL